MRYDFSHWEKLPKVSCQCITYGRTTLLDEAVECFLRQDYPGEKELIILNDLLELEIACDLPDVHVVNLPIRMKTIGEKRNTCVGLCSGDIIFPWDDDDISLPWRISYSIQQMKNHHYFKANKMWDWKCGVIGQEPKKHVAHAMGAWSVEFFDEVSGYPHIQSGQDQAIEVRFRGDRRYVEDTPEEWIYYVYRFPGTGSYHLSALGYGKGHDGVGRYVKKKDISGSHEIDPHWEQDYIGLLPGPPRRIPVVSGKSDPDYERGDEWFTDPEEGVR